MEENVCLMPGTELASQILTSIVIVAWLLFSKFVSVRLLSLCVTRDGRIKASKLLLEMDPTIMEKSEHKYFWQLIVLFLAVVNNIISKNKNLG